MTISVIIPVYNAEPYIEKAVQSALQLKIVKEVVIIEDGSNDDSLGICREIIKDNSRVKLFQHSDKKNHGPSASRNLGLKYANGDFIAFLDADDVFLPNRFDADLEIFNKNPDADGVYNAIGVQYFSKTGEALFKETFGKSITTVNKLVAPAELFPGLMGYTSNFGYFHLDGLTIKRSALKKLDHWFNPGLRLHEDTDFSIRLSFYTSLYPGQIKEPVALRGIHDQNQITQLRKNINRSRQNQKKLWDSVYSWAESEKDLPQVFKRHLKRMKISRSIPAFSWLKGLFIFKVYCFRDPALFLKNKYYDYLHSFFWGDRVFSKFLLKVKYKLQKILGISGELK